MEWSIKQMPRYPLWPRGHLSKNSGDAFTFYHAKTWCRVFKSWQTCQVEKGPVETVHLRRIWRGYCTSSASTRIKDGTFMTFEAPYTCNGWTSSEMTTRICNSWKISPQKCIIPSNTCVRHFTIRWRAAECCMKSFLESIPNQMQGAFRLK